MRGTESWEQIFDLGPRTRVAGVEGGHGGGKFFCENCPIFIKKNLPELNFKRKIFLVF